MDESQNEQEFDTRPIELSARDSLAQKRHERIKQVESHLSPEQKSNFPSELISEHPGLLDKTETNDIPQYSTEMIRDTYFVIVDGPAYTDSMRRFPELTTQLYAEWREKKDEILKEEPFFQEAFKTTSAGDEDSTAAPIKSTNPLVLQAFALKSQASFARILKQDEKYAPLRQHLREIKRTDRPHVIVGIVHGDMAATFVETAPDPDGDSDARLVTISPEIEKGKGLGTKGKTQIATATETAEIASQNKSITQETQRINGVSAGIELDIVPEQKDAFVNILKELQIKVYEEEDHLDIRFPENIEGWQEDEATVLDFYADKLLAKARELERNNQLRDEEQEEFYNNTLQRLENSEIDPEKVKSLAEKTTWDRDKENAPEAKEEGFDAAVAFTNVQGLNEFRARFQEGVLTFIDDQDLRAELTEKATAHAVRFLVHKLSQETSQQYWKWENIEVNGDEVKFIMNWNIQKKDPDVQSFFDNQGIAISLIKGLDSFQAEEFQEEFIDFVSSAVEKEHDPETSGVALKKEVVEQFMRTHFTGFNFTTSTGLNCSELYKGGPPDYVISEKQQKYRWQKVIGGSADSKAARRAGVIPHGRIQDRINLIRHKAPDKRTQEEKTALIGWSDAQEGLSRLQGENVMALEYEAAQRLGIPEEAMIIAKSVILKGMEPQDQAFIKLSDLAALIEE